MTDILLTNGTVVHPDGQRQEDILIRDEKITEVGSDITASHAQTIDCSNHLIFAGVIDPHTHMGIPIKDGWSTDDFASGSRSALNGGVTTIIDFTILGQDQSLIESVDERLELAKNCLCDYSLHCNITHFNEDLLREIPILIENGITSFKVFTTYREAGMWLSYGQIEKVAEVLAQFGGLLMVHAEDDEILATTMEPLVDKGFTAPKYHGLSRPTEAEAEAVSRITRIISKTGCPGYIVHLSSQAGLETAATTPELLLETCPQYLLLDHSAYEQEDGRMFVASPPLRTSEDNQALWEGLRTGRIFTLGTDHCPFNRADKKEGIPFQQIPNGMGGVETLFPVMLAQFIERNLDLSQLARLTSANPALIFGLQHRKGFIKPGFDADLVVVNPQTIAKDWTSRLVAATDWNAYSGFPAVFPKHVFLRGQPVVENDELAGGISGIFIPNLLEI